MEQVHGRGLQQFDGRVGCLQWPPFREGYIIRFSSKMNICLLSKALKQDIV